jgi:hypothetical protein
VIHEFNHSFCNPLVFAHREQLRRAGEKLYAPRAKEMQQQAYGHWHEMLQETLVRACVVRYLARYEGHLAASQETASQYSQGFIWTGPLAELLAGYERQRQEYRTLADFMPKVVDFFNAQAAAEEPTTYPATRPVGPGADAATGARKVSAWPYAAGGGDAAGAVGFGRSSSSPRRCCWQLWCPFG